MSRLRSKTEPTSGPGLESLSASDRRLVEQFLVLLRNEFGPRLRDFRVFGSKIRGETHEESDLDLLVLIKQRTTADRTRIISAALDLSPWIDVKVIDWDAYHSPMSRATGFYKEMRQHSVRP
ncbi:MAG: nucleotidyltransferase domain-containing protein [Actinomycetota bacterium]